MTPERWAQINRLFESALRLGARERGPFLARECAGDEALRREVESLVASHEQAGGFIEEPAVAVAAKQAAVGAPSLAGRAVAHYRVLSLIGAGGVGEVYLAEDTRLGRKAALKFLPDHLSDDAGRVRRFEREARRLGAQLLEHPHRLRDWAGGLQTLHRRRIGRGRDAAAAPLLGRAGAGPGARHPSPLYTHIFGPGGRDFALQ